MAQWKYTLSIKDEWNACKEERISLRELIQTILTKLQAFKIEDDAELENLLDDFEMLAEDGEPDVEEFDNLWDSLYNWADQETEPGHWPKQKLCWIQTF